MGNIKNGSARIKAIERERLVLYLSACNKYFSLSLIYFPLSSSFLYFSPSLPLLFSSLSLFLALVWMFVFSVLGQAFICSLPSNSAYCISHSINRVIRFSPFFSLTQIHFLSNSLWVFLLWALYPACASFSNLFAGNIDSWGFNYGVLFPNLSYCCVFEDGFFVWWCFRISLLCFVELGLVMYQESNLEGLFGGCFWKAWSVNYSKCIALLFRKQARLNIFWLLGVSFLFYVGSGRIFIHWAGLIFKKLRKAFHAGGCFCMQFSRFINSFM